MFPSLAATDTRDLARGGHAARAIVWVAALSLNAVAACGPPQAGHGGTLLPPLTLIEVGPRPVVPGTRLIVRGSGFVPAEVAGLAARFVGERDGAPLDVSVTPTVVDAETLEVPVTGPLLDALDPAAGGSFQGELRVTRTPAGPDPAETASLPLSVTLAANVTPRLDAVEPSELYPGDTVTLRGDGLLHPSEGAALVVLDGEFVTQVPPEVRTISGLTVPAAPTDPGARAAVSFTLTPDLLGVRPGVFRGEISVWNQTPDGDVRPSEPLSLDAWRLHRPRLDEVAPDAASRGQWITFRGAGLLPPDGLLQATTLLLLEGRFSPQRGPVQDLTGVHALALYPDESVSNAELSVVLRVDKGVDGELRGLGLMPGLFEGTATPLVLFGEDVVRGEGVPLRFTVLSPLQVVYVKFLPAFDDALAEFGLAAARERVVARIFDVLARDYEGVNIAFQPAPPADFAEFSTVEVGGRDPNGTGLFGLDNTAGKDVGNLRFDDVVGGFNAETRSQGYAAYGGIFAAEFLNLSPSLSDSPLASPRFDDVFGPFAPPLGGEPLEPGEVDAAGARGEAAREAARVLGNLLGNTITHEVGHSLGLAAIDGQFHNIGDNPGWIMDAGAFRPFLERAELDGEGPEFFAPFNRTYLETILPPGESP